MNDPLIGLWWSRPWEAWDWITLAWLVLGVPLALAWAVGLIVENREPHRNFNGLASGLAKVGELWLAAGGFLGIAWFVAHQ